MQNEMRDRLIELIDDFIHYENANDLNSDERKERLADYLIEEGVIVPPCKVGNEVWFIRKDMVPDDDYRMHFHSEWVMGKVRFQLSMINLLGKTVFLTKEEAEKALKEGADNG